MKALLPALNSPTTTSRNSSSSCAEGAGEGLLVGGVHVQAGQHRLEVAEQAALLGQERLLAGIEHGSEHGREGKAVSQSTAFPAPDLFSRRGPAIVLRRGARGQSCGYVPRASFSKRGLPRSGSKLGSMRSQAGREVVGDLQQRLQEVQRLLVVSHEDVDPHDLVLDVRAWKGCLAIGQSATLRSPSRTASALRPR